MAPVSLSPDQINTAKKKASSDILFVFSENEVEMDLQIIMFHHGVVTAKALQGLEDTREGVRRVFKVQFGLDGDDSLDMRTGIGAILSAWEASSAYIKGETDARVAAREAGMVRMASVTEHDAMRKAVKTCPGVGSVSDVECPNKTMMGIRLTQIEDNAPRPEFMTEVCTVDDGEADTMPSFDKQGRLRMDRGTGHSAPPKDPEALRMKHRVIGISWLMGAKRHPNRSWLMDMDIDVWRRFSDYILGDKVDGLTIKASGQSARRPLWDDHTLAYEAEIRKEAYAMVRDGAGTLAVCLEKAWTNTDLRSLKFVTVFQTQPEPAPMAAKREYHSDDEDDQPPWKRQRSSNKIKDHKGAKMRSQQRDYGAKVSDHKDANGLFKSLPKDGSFICFRYNNDSDTCRGNKCGMVHVCRKCLGKHPLSECPNNGAGGRVVKGKGRGKAQGKNKPQGKGRRGKW